MPANLSNLTKPKSKSGRRSSGFSWVRLSGRIKLLSFVAIFVVVGSAYLLYSHAATIETGPIIVAGDTRVTDSEALAAGDPVAGDILNTTSTLVNNNDGIATTDAATVSCSKFTLNRIVDGPDGNHYDLNNDRYGGGDQCASNSDGKSDFKVYDGGTGTTTGGVKAFPNLIRGCSNSQCYSNNWPKLESSIGNWSATGNITTNNAGGSWDAAIDMWFNRSNSIGPSRGTEILIDLNRKNRSRPTSYYKHFVNVLTDGSGNTYDLYFWRQTATINGASTTWNFLHYWRNSETYSVNNLNLNQFWNKATTITCPNSAPCLRPSWYLTGIDTGFEIWSGGYGLQWSGVNIHS